MPFLGRFFISKMNFLEIKITEMQKLKNLPF